MKMIVNTLFQWSGFEPPKRTERVLWIASDRSQLVTIDIEDTKAWPTVYDVFFLEQCFSDNKICIVEDDPYSYLRHHDPKFLKTHQERWDKAWDIIKNIVLKDGKSRGEELFYSHVLGPLVRQSAEEMKCTRKQVYIYLRKYWQRGQMKNALLPLYDRCGVEAAKRELHGPKRGRPSEEALEKGVPTGINVTDEIKKNFRLGTKLFYDTPKKLGKHEAFERILARFFNKGKDVDNTGHRTTIMPPIEELPSFRQYQYWYDHEWNFTRSTLTREGTREYNLKRRAVLGSLIPSIPGPGFLYQLDAAIADTYLVSAHNRRRIIGRPVIYVVVDTYSSLIVGISVSLEGPSWLGAMYALENMVLDKVTFCREYGFDIEVDEWPSQHLPKELLADRGELLSKKSDNLTNGLNIRMAQTAPYRPDWKACVERHIGLLKIKYISWTPGKVDDAPRRSKKDYRLDACMTLHDFREFLIDCVLEHNTTYSVPVEHLDPALIADGIEPYPCNLWKWGVDNRSGYLQEVPLNTMRANLLPDAIAKVTSEGIRYRNRWYTCKRAEEEKWFEQVRSGKKSWNIPIAYDQRTSDFIYFRRGGKEPLEICTHLRKERAEFLHHDWFDVDDYFALCSQAKKDGASYRLQKRVEHRERRDHMLKKAHEKTEAARPEGETKADRLHIQDFREAEQAQEQKVDAWDFQKEDASPLEQKKDAAQEELPNTSKARRLALLRSKQDGNAK